jgi:hypothetical protein
MRKVALTARGRELPFLRDFCEIQKVTKNMKTNPITPTTPDSTKFIKNMFSGCLNLENHGSSEQNPG